MVEGVASCVPALTPQASVPFQPPRRYGLSPIS